VPKRSALAITIAAAVVPGPGDAQEAGRELAPITVTDKKVAGPADIGFEAGTLPTPTTLIEREEIERTNQERDAGTLLRRVPGIMVHTIGQGDTGNAVKMRGFLSATHGADAAVYIDGMPQNLPSSMINHGMNDMSWLTPDMVERIAVVKGPFSALYGDQNRSGAVDIVTRTKARSNVAVTVGSHGTRRGSVVLSGDAGPIESLFIADVFRTDGYRDNNDGDRSTLFWKGTLRQGGSVWSLRAVHHEADWNAPGFLSLDSLRAGTVKPTDRDPTSARAWGDAGRTSLVLTYGQAQTDAGLSGTMYFEKYRRNRALGANATDLNVLHDNRNIYGGRALYNLLLGPRGGITVGGEIRADRGDAINRRYASGIPSDLYSANQDLDLLTYGLFAQGQYKPLDSLKLVAGARVDRFDYDIRNRKLPAASVRYDRSVFTPRAGIVWTPVGNVDLFANVGQGFRSPSQAELSPSGALGPLGAAGGAGNPNVAPPKLRSVDIGFNAFVTPRWQIGAAYYHTKNSGEIAQVAPGIFDNVGNTTRDGWEASSTFHATDSLRVYGSYGRLIRSRIDSAAPGAADRLSLPEHMVKAGVGWTTPFTGGRLLLNGDFSWVSPTPYFSGTPARIGYARPYSRYDLRATYETGPWQWTAFATFQPIRYGSEVVVAAAGGGASIDPRPRSEVGITGRYFF